MNLRRTSRQMLIKWHRLTARWPASTLAIGSVRVLIQSSQFCKCGLASPPLRLGSAFSRFGGLLAIFPRLISIFPFSPTKHGTPPDAEITLETNGCPVFVTHPHLAVRHLAGWPDFDRAGAVLAERVLDLVRGVSTMQRYVAT